MPFRTVRPTVETASCRDDILEPGPRRELVDSLNLDLAPNFSDDWQVGRGVLDDDRWRRSLV